MNSQSKFNNINFSSSIPEKAIKVSVVIPVYNVEKYIDAWIALLHKHCVILKLLP